MSRHHGRSPPVPLPLPLGFTCGVMIAHHWRPCCPVLPLKCSDPGHSQALAVAGCAGPFLASLSLPLGPLPSTQRDTPGRGCPPCSSRPSLTVVGSVPDKPALVYL